MTLTNLIIRQFDVDQNQVWKTKSRLYRWGLYIGMVFLSIIYFFPIYWMLKSSVQTTDSLYDPEIVWIPTEITYGHIYELWFGSQFPIFFKNSMIVAIGVTAITVVCSILAGYALTRFKFSGKRTIANLTIISYMYPPILLGIPLFILWFRIDLVNTYTGLILAQCAITLPFSIWLMWQFFQTIPISLEESAWMYGASRFQSFRDVALPMAMPGIIAVAIFSFAVSWNDYTLATMLMREQEMRTLPVGVLFFTEQFQIDWGLVLSAALFIAIPPFLLVYFLQKYLLQGFKITT